MMKSDFNPNTNEAEGATNLYEFKISLDYRAGNQTAKAREALSQNNVQSLILKLAEDGGW